MEIKQEVVFCRAIANLEDRTSTDGAVVRVSSVWNINFCSHYYRSWSFLVVYYAPGVVLKCFIIFLIITLWNHLIILFAISYRSGKLIPLMNTKFPVKPRDPWSLVLSHNQYTAFSIVFNITNDEACIVGGLDFVLSHCNFHGQWSKDA